jgi:anti-sigma factor RsiW
MTLTRDVILDLMPLYLSDEASSDTRALVEHHLDADPDLARLAEEWKRRLPEAPPPPVSPDAQALAYREAKRQIANRVITLAIVIAGGIFALGGAALMGAMFLIKM